jgi:hypothetical protein
LLPSGASVLANAAVGAEAGSIMPLRIGVYDVEPYGGQDREGLFVGASVDLWRRVAEDLNWQYRLTLVGSIDPGNATSVIGYPHLSEIFPPIYDT